MSAYAIYEKLDSRDYNAEITDAGKYIRTRNRSFYVFCDSDLDDAGVAASFTGLPVALESYPFDIDCRVKSLSSKHYANIKNDDEDTLGRIWELSYKYTNQWDFDPAEMVAGSPTSRPPKISITWEAVEEAVRYDVSTPPAAVVNSAGMPFDPGVVMKRGIPIITINLISTNTKLISLGDYQDVVNELPYKGLPAGVLQLRGMTENAYVEDGLTLYDRTFTIAVNWRGWLPTYILDAGFMQIGATPDIKQVITDQFGAPFSSASLLDGAGVKLEDGEDPVLLDFNLFREIDFNLIIA